MSRQRNYSGFTLIEILVVVGLIAILAAITIVAINPAKNFESTRNTQRSSDISAILNAITQYTSEEGNTLAGLVTDAGLDVALTACSGQPSTAGVEIVNNVNGDGSQSTGSDDDVYLDLESVLVSDYIVAIPEDPNGTSETPDGGTLTGYWVCASEGGRVQVYAPGTEPTATATDLYVVR